MHGLHLPGLSPSQSNPFRDDVSIGSSAKAFQQAIDNEARSGERQDGKAMVLVVSVPRILVTGCAIVPIYNEAE